VFQAHSIAQVTTNTQARAVFPTVPRVHIILYGRFYRVQKPFHGGGMAWDLKVALKPGQNTLTLLFSNAAYK
jgi:hypothetical protein